MSFSLESISKGRAVKAPRIVLLGVEKIGKSTLASGADNPIFIPIKGETGLDDLDVAKFPTAQTYADVIDAIRVLYQEDHDYKTVVIDSASTLERLVWEQTCQTAKVPSIERVGGGFGKGYVEALKLWQELMDGLDAIRDEKNMACIIVGHVKVKVFNDPLADPYDTYLFDVNDKASNAMFRWADSILFGNVKTIVNKHDAGFNKSTARATSTNQRMLYTQKRPAHPGGGRGPYGRLPYEIPMDWQEFMAEVAKASQDAPAT